MNVQFLTPAAGIVAATALVPLAVLALRQRRLRTIRATLGLEEPRLRSLLPLAAVLTAIPALLGLAAMQPVVETKRVVPERTDAQVFVVLDISRSMLARTAPSAPMRLDRARDIALGLQERFPEVPFGVATLTDRLLPHVFPTTDRRVTAATVLRTLGVERPPPAGFFSIVATNLNALRGFPERNFFPPSAKTRVVVVLTDGETQPPDEAIAGAFGRQPKVQTVFVHVWGSGERIYEAGIPESGYAASDRSAGDLARLASLTGGRVIEEGDEAGLVEAVRAAVGTGETVNREQQSGRFALMPYVTLATLLPLALLLALRNAWWHRPSLPALRRRSEEGRAEAPEGAKVMDATGRGAAWLAR